MNGGYILEQKRLIKVEYKLFYYENFYLNNIIHSGLMKYNFADENLQKIFFSEVLCIISN